MRTTVQTGGQTTDNNVRQQVLVFLALAALTGLELAVAHAGAATAARATALVGLAMAKVTLVLLFFMRLRLESLALRLAALVPLVVSPPLAVVLMLDAMFRMRGGR
jgi:heme/copper-type cytochrome/quinol oxidase subunit 4